MAKDGEPAKSVDKGKGKSVETDPSKSEEPKKDKDGKPLANGTKEEGLIGGEQLVSR
jgi:26S proteasome regulatory subunit N1